MPPARRRRSVFIIANPVPVSERQHAPVSPALIELVVNGQRHWLAAAPERTLLEILREDLALTGTKHGCELGECGLCTVLVQGQPRLACLTLAVEVDGEAVTTVEGLASAHGLHPLQRAFLHLSAAQCGYCTPAMLLTAKALLDANPAPSREETRQALAGTLCRCTGYGRIVEAVQRAAADLTGRP